MITKDANSLKNPHGLNKPDLKSAAENTKLQAFNRVVLLYQDEIFALTVWILGDDDSAEEITQNTFLTAYRSMSPFRNDPIRRRLYQIAAKACFDKLQRGQSQLVQPIGYDIKKEDYPLTGDNFSDSSTSSENGHESKASDHLVQQAFHQLNPYQRAVIFLVDLQDFSYREAALILEISIGTVNSHLARARLRLHNQLREIGAIKLPT